MVAHYSPLGRWEGAFFFFTDGGRGILFSTRQEKKELGVLQDCRCGLCGGVQRENPPRGLRVFAGGGREGGGRVSSRSLLQIFVCRNVFQAAPPCDRWHRGTMCFVFRVQSAASETHGPISGEVCSVSVSVALRAVGLCVEVLQPNVFLFQRDFFTVCFTAESREELGSIPTSHRSHESTIQFFFCG